MSDVETVEDATAGDAVRTAYGAIVIVGGGCYGSYYLRQLARAKKAGALKWERVVVVDRDANCAVSRSEDAAGEGVELVVSDWMQYFESYFAQRPAPGSARDAIVPSPLMPHLMYDWLKGRARRRWPERTVATSRFELPASFPWQRETDDGTRYVSFAEWMCPVNCIEPRLCPHTKGERSWSIPDTLRSAMSNAAAEKGLKGPVIFHCTHRAYGVGMIDTDDVLAADEFVAERCSGGGDVFIGTVSHCHGALNVLSVSS